MTESELLVTPQDVSDIAWELFKERASQTGISAEQIAIDCFRDAAAFSDVAKRVLDGSLKPKVVDPDPLDDAFAPNLKRTHPINLMSKMYGALPKVRSVMGDLTSKPGTEHYNKYAWGQAEANQARALFPAVLERARQLTVKESK